MDLVRTSAATGIAAMAAVALAAGGARSLADPLPAFTPGELASLRIQARIDDAFRTAEPVQTFGLTGPALPSPAPVPVLPYARRSRVDWPVASTSAGKWSTYVDEAAHRFGIPAEWVWRVMMQESGGRTHLNGLPITSPAGAMGLMQVMPATFAEMSARHGLGTDPYEPRANILAGAAYLRAMYDRYGPAHFLAAYNAGPGRVDEHLRSGRALPLETRAYTAALQPRLVPAYVTSALSAATSVQDLTSAATFDTLTSTPSRSPAGHATGRQSNALFATTAAPRETGARQVGAQPSDGLFVSLVGVDRRREAMAGTPRDQ